MFGKKKAKELPVDEVKELAGKGMSDRDIIKDLKSRGYSYEDIEKAMLQSVKEGVDTEPQQYQERQPVMDYQEPVPAFELPAEPAVTEGEDLDVALDELIEGVVNEKWEKFEDRLAKVEAGFEHARKQLKHMESRVGQESIQRPSSEVESRITDISHQLDDLDARVGGLEKAFRQFLPSLTKNVESLSQLIHEIKEKHEMLEEEV